MVSRRTLSRRIDGKAAGGQLKLPSLRRAVEALGNREIAGMWVRIDGYWETGPCLTGND
jgi:hypothetical protein